jgi:peptidoglycan/xylan/chitin deacetylase (PgdA/CDA1 family)
MRVPGLNTARTSAMWLRTRLNPGAVILGYHRIADAGDDPFDMCVSPANFAEQLEALGAIAHVLPVEELVNRAAAGTAPKRAVAITFDDGYADVLESAVPLLRRAATPATVFIVSGLLGAEFWWDRLAAITARHAEASMPGDDDRSVHSLYLRLRSQPDEQRETFLREFDRELPPIATAVPRSVTVEELRQLASEPLIDVGAHTHTHAWLPALDASSRISEIASCRTDLEEITGRPVSGFSFPYGGCSHALREEVRSAGYAFACVSHGGVLSARQDRYSVPRFWVRNQDGRMFARWLKRWLHV